MLQLVGLALVIEIIAVVIIIIEVVIVVIEIVEIIIIIVIVVVQIVAIHFVADEASPVKHGGVAEREQRCPRDDFGQSLICGRCHV
jgi:hypothetical protein